MMTAPLVHVLIINWNGLEHLEACLESLLAGDYPNARFVLLDNGSTDGSVAFVRTRFGHDTRIVVCELGENLGWSRGNNEGIRRALEAGAEYVLLLNNDTWTASNAIRELIAFAEATPQAGAIAPKMVLFDQPDLINSVGIACSIIGVGWDEGLGRVDTPRWNEPRRVLGACGGASLLRCSALRKTGLLPTDFDIYLDDLDLCLRLWSAGYEVWSCPRAVVRHKFSATMGTGAQYRRKYFLNTRNRLRLILRNFPVSRTPVIALMYGLGEIRAVVRAPRDGAWWRLAVHVRSWWAGLLYAPVAMRARREQRVYGGIAMRFWPLVRRCPLFFPGIELPERGWYAPRACSGVLVRPMSRRAWLETQGGRLRLLHANCYPQLGETCIEVSASGRVLCELRTRDHAEQYVDVPPGVLEFTARRLFEAEETGERVDLGGWIAVQP
jgi:hypothetical protein